MRLVEAGGWGRMISHRAEVRPGHAERLRRPWEAGECAAMGPVVGIAEVGSGE